MNEDELRKLVKDLLWVIESKTPTESVLVQEVLERARVASA